jgi:DNA-binding CsgD family transcriptional regulator
MGKMLLERERELRAVEVLLDRCGRLLVVEGGAGLGKTSLVEAACRRAEELGYEVLRSRGSELEAEFAFGVVRQLFERRLIGADGDEREALLSGPAGAARPLVFGGVGETAAADRSFAVLHGLYWLAANLAGRGPLLLVVDDAQWADEPSLRWSAYLAARLEGLAIGLLVALRPGEPTETSASLMALRREATIARLASLSAGAVETIVRGRLGDDADGELSAAVWSATGGNPLYVAEILRAVEFDERRPARLEPAALLVAAREGIAERVIDRIRAAGPGALRLGQALAVLGDGCELRHVAAIAGVETTAALRLAAGLARVEVLVAGPQPAFIHPVVRDALEASLEPDEWDALHRAAARLLHAEGTPAGRVAAHLLSVAPAGDRWVFDRMRQAAQEAIAGGAPQAAADLLARALDEPPPPALLVEVLREAARAEASAGRETATVRLEEALRLTAHPRERAVVALEAAETYAALFQWTDAVDAVERALGELGDADEALVARLEGELVVCGLHDARRAARVAPVLERLSSRSATGSAAEAVAVARGMATVLGGWPAEGAAAPHEEALSQAGGWVENWDRRAALLWSLIAAERFEPVEAALQPMLADVHRTGSARGFVAAYSTLGLLKLRLGALPEADAAARVALRVLHEGDFAAGLAFAATVLAEVAVEAGELDEAEALLSLLPQADWPPGVGTVLIPAARGRLRLAQNRPAEALADFKTGASMFSHDVWGIEIRDVGYLHARAGAAQALLRLGEHERARELADAELADVRAFGAPRALGTALCTAGLAHGGKRGLELLGESVDVLRGSPALLVRARSLAELGAALRRDGKRAAAREPLAEALDLAARCGARPLAKCAREELAAAGARPRRAWRTGLESLTPSELRIVRLAAGGRSNREIAHELYVTLKTVEGHLSRAYAKLAVGGRAELPRVLDREKTRVSTL